MALLSVAGPWGPRENISTVARRYYERMGRLPDNWVKAQKFIDGNFENMGYHQQIRWEYDKPARVITGGSLYAVWHPTVDRLLTHREVARIMGFPDDWKIKPLRDRSNLRLTWGKGIPVGSGRWISTWVRNSINGFPGSITGELLRENERVIDCTKVKLVA
jgi:site-specific DNA-cytosine methylase